MPRPQRTRSSENDRTRFFPFVSFAVFFHVPPFSVFLSSFECDLPPQRCARHSFLLSRSKKYLYRNNRDRFVSIVSTLFVPFLSTIKNYEEMKLKMENGRGEIVSIEQSKNYINSWKAFLVEKNSRMENHWRNDRVYAQSNPCSRSSRSRDTLLIWIPDELFNGAISLMHRDSSSIKTRRNDVCSCSTEESSSAFGHGILRFPPPPPPPSFASFNCESSISGTKRATNHLPGTVTARLLLLHIETQFFPLKIPHAAVCRHAPITHLYYLLSLSLVEFPCFRSYSLSCPFNKIIYGRRFLNS